MAANYPNNNVPPVSGAAVAPARVWPADIEQVDAFARKLYKRARTAGSELDEVATAVRSLHTVLKHLKFEAEDPESLLGADDGSGSVYARQLTPILEDSEFALKQLDTILEKYSGESGAGTQMDGEKGWTLLESREREMVDLIRSKLVNQKLNIDIFLDTIQLHNPSKSRRIVDTNSADLESIKDKVDAIASRICQRKSSNLADGNNDEEERWKNFRDELEKAGFSREVVRKNQDVIRAYIRQLDEQLSAYGGSTPSVRGLLEHYRPRRDDGLQITPYPTYPTDPAVGELSPEELQSEIDEEKLFPSMRMRRLEEEDEEDNNHQTAVAQPPPPPLSNSSQPLSMPDHPSNLSYDRRLSNGGADDASMALMSTRELMALDKRSAELAVTAGNKMHPQPPPAELLPGPNYHTSNSPTPHSLPPSASHPALPSSSLPAIGVNNATSGEQSSAHPRYVPPLPLPRNHSPPVVNPASSSAPVISQQREQSLALVQQQQSRCARLAPDSKGRDIPLEAKWTRIPRHLVSPEALAGAGVRYEARPDFVAVLGELSRNEVAKLAQKTAEVRNARRRRSSTVPNSAGGVGTAAVPNGNANGVRKDRRAEDKYYPDKYRNWNVIEEEERRRQRPKASGRNHRYSDDDDSSSDDSRGVTYVVNNNRQRRRASTASSASHLYDSSDDSRTSDAETDTDRDLDASSSYSQSYPRSGSHLDDYHKSRSHSLRRSSTTPTTSSKRDDKAYARVRSRNDSDATDGANGHEKDSSNEKGTKTYPFIVPAPAASEKDKDKDGASTSPAATIKPKPILKNKKDDPHVRIDPTPQIIDESSSSLPRTLPSYRRSERERERRDREKDKDRERDRDRERNRDKDRDREKDRDRDRDREKRYRSDRYQDKERDRDRERHPDRERDRDRERSDRYRGDKYYSHRDSHRDRDRDRSEDGVRETEYPHRHRHRSHSHSRRYHGNGGGSSSNTGARRSDRDREYYDDHYINSNNSRVRDDRTSRRKAQHETIRAVGLGGAAAAMLSMLSEAAL
ncbi:uncharacterized protein F4822DRAFT_423595 [Hypoxylon trugodes]|uniref:uncharacterized protein n=1 Tax=Hypoxylon trugodes TaxID=326681 RepID=UPI00219CBB16|nr:uncharacterized protein F4822DRAFT_423595 [Hypoxylon trugodes]KAI1393132.1 hypothetical protein F4822DRAFT_423595 [Hypoxylon trugodes]